MDSKDLSEKIKNAVENLKKLDDDISYKFELDDKFAVYVGWENGFDENDNTIIHSKNQPNYCLCVKVAENLNNLWFGMDDAYMPCFVDSKEVYDSDISIGIMCNYDALALKLIHLYEDMKNLLEKKIITF